MVKYFLDVQQKSQKSHQELKIELLNSEALQKYKYVG